MSKAKQLSSLLLVGGKEKGCLCPPRAAAWQEGRIEGLPQVGKGIPFTSLQSQILHLKLIVKLSHLNLTTYTWIPRSYFWA